VPATFVEHVRGVVDPTYSNAAPLVAKRLAELDA
jgi:hypothetical protein